MEKVSGENWFADLAFPFPFNLLPPDVSWGLSMGLEIIAPIALILGFATRFFSFALIILTIVAIAVVHWPAGMAHLSAIMARLRHYRPRLRQLQTAVNVFVHANLFVI